MSGDKTTATSGRMMTSFTAAYVGALAIIGAMVLTTYLLLQQGLADARRAEALETRIDAQKVLSTKIPLLVAESLAGGAAKRADLARSLRQAVRDFEDGHGELVRLSAPLPAPGSRGDLPRPGQLLFEAPVHLDRLAAALARRGQVLAAELEHAPSPGSSAALPSPGDAEQAARDRGLAEATLAAYDALGTHIAAQADARFRDMVSTHRTLCLATLAVIVLVATFIFRPLSRIILRRTHELVEARNSMAFIAVHDGLTGLHNRSFLTDHFDALLKSAERRRERLAVVQLDLDRFKLINDTLGHAAGDYVLVVTAQRIREACRAADLCVRLGGDEFVLVLNGAGAGGDIEGVAQRILSRVNEPMTFQGATINPGASAGIAVFPVDADNAEDLMVHADLALYAAKRQGGGGVSFFSEALRQELEHRKQLEQDLRAAIANDGFSVFFQPQVALTDGAITGVEALARWSQPSRGPIAPAEFIPAAEKAGLMVPIGRIIVRKAIAQAAQWHRESVPFGRIAINVSSAEIRESDFAAFLFETLAAAGLPAERVSLEIIELVILDDEKTGIAERLRLIRAAGVHLELDDFGTGYASLSHVNPNEIDRLKIDRRFVQNIDANGDNTKIVRAITELARGLGISIIAEGAETEAELDALLSIGCQEVQGFSIAFPMPGAQASAWLTTHAKSVRQQPSTKAGSSA